MVCLVIQEKKNMHSRSFINSYFFVDDVNRDKGYDRTSNISESHKKFASFFDPLQNLAEKNRLFDFKTYSIADWSSISTMVLFSVLLILFVWIDVKGDLVGQYDKNSIPVKKPEVSDTKTEQQQQK